MGQYVKGWAPPAHPRGIRCGTAGEPYLIFQLVHQNIPSVKDQGQRKPKTKTKIGVSPLVKSHGRSICSHSSEASGSKLLAQVLRESLCLLGLVSCSQGEGAHTHPTTCIASSSLVLFKYVSPRVKQGISCCGCEHLAVHSEAGHSFAQQQSPG